MTAGHLPATGCGPPQLMSRAYAVYRLIVRGVTPLGSMTAGVLVSHGGDATWTAVACVVVLGVPVWIAPSCRSSRDLGRSVPARSERAHERLTRPQPEHRKESACTSH